MHTLSILLLTLAALPASTLRPKPNGLLWLKRTALTLGLLSLVIAFAFVWPYAVLQGRI